jgi:predicted ATPase
MINSVRLENFKNFRDATLTLGPLTVIVGTNASGKSNLRDAFRFLHGVGRGYSLADIVGEKFVDGVKQWSGIRGGTREVPRFGSRSFSIESKVNWDYNNGIFTHRICVGCFDEGIPVRVVKESLYLNDKLIFDAEPHESSDPGLREGLKVRYLTNGIEQEYMEGQFVIDYPVLNQLLFSEAINPAFRIWAKVFRIHINSMRFLDLSPEAMKNFAVRGQPLGDRGENLSSVLQAICTNAARKKAMMEWIRQLTPLDVVDFEFPEDPTGRVLVSLVEANGNKLSAFSASDGTLRFLALIAALLAPDPAQFYFFEEIDNGIHPTRLSLLLQLIEQQVKKGKVQIVATTHSPQLLTMLSPESREHAYLVYRNEREPDAQLQRIMDIPSAKDVLERHTLGRMLETGWFENTMDFVTNDKGAK